METSNLTHMHTSSHRRTHVYQGYELAVPLGGELMIESWDRKLRTENTTLKTKSRTTTQREQTMGSSLRDLPTGLIALSRI